MTGRPTLYTDELAAEVCSRLSGNGPTARPETLADICRDEHMPAVRTISDWKKAHAEFSADFTCARDEGFDALASECLNIADDSSGDVEYPDDDLEGQGHGGSLRRQRGGATEGVQRAKLRIETRLKLLAKWDPKRYGDKVQQEISGPDGGPVQVTRIELVAPDDHGSD